MSTIEAADLLRCHGFGVFSYEEIGLIRSILASHIESADHEFGMDDVKAYQKLESRIDGEHLAIEMARIEKAKAI